jgi:hypothetical protein
MTGVGQEVATMNEAGVREVAAKAWQILIGLAFHVTRDSDMRS